MFEKLSEKKWFNGAVIACIGVAFYVLLTNLPAVLAGLRRFIGYFRPVILGVVFAYIMRPVAKFFYYRVFKKMKVGKARWYLSVLFAVVLLLAALLLLIGTLIPQLVSSLSRFTANFDTYAASLIEWLDRSVLHSLIDWKNLELLSANAMDSISAFLQENSSRILSFAASSGKNILSTLIALILAIYLLIDMKRVMQGVQHFLRTILGMESYEALMDFVLRCDTILVNYLVQSLFDSLIVGAACAIFMLLMRMPYVGLISVVVGVTNLIPNFGPVIGGGIGAFILLLMDPKQALIFIFFCILLQIVDGYILKPKLFSNSMGVSGLVILIATIVLGNMFGIMGVLLAIPTAAVLSFIYHDYFMTGIQKRRQMRA